MDSRYQTPEMAAIWNPARRNQLERELWVRVMRAQQDAGVPILDETIEDYESAARDIPDFGDIELAEIAQIEAQTRHDLYARMTYFNRVAGHEAIHLGLTSADIVENVQQKQIDLSLAVLAQHGANLMMRLVTLANAHALRPMVGRTHGRPAQLTTVGKRMTDWLTELMCALGALLDAEQTYLPRGIKGAIGTRADMVALLHRHSPDRDALQLADQIDTELGSIPDPDGHGGEVLALSSCGQVYPRSIDLPWASAALQLAAACDTIATNVRLWVVLGHASEHQQPGQIGSSAMPHKTNPRYSERVHSLAVVARGYHSMLAELAGAQWFEGDVSTSAARRIALPGLLTTVDAILANTTYVLDCLDLDWQAISEDVHQHLPQLATGLVLEASVAAGVPRSTAHAVILEHTRETTDLLDWTIRLEADPRLQLRPGQVDELLNIGRLVEPAQWIVERTCKETMDEIVDFELDEGWPGQLL